MSHLPPAPEFGSWVFRVVDARKELQMSFREQVVLALLQNLEWMPKFNTIESAAEYLGETVPESDKEAIAFQQRIIALLVTETAEQIVKFVYSQK